MHRKNSENPTSYRFSSLYIKLFRSIIIEGSDGATYRYKVLWSTSVPTYIMVICHLYNTEFEEYYSKSR